MLTSGVCPAPPPPMAGADFPTTTTFLQPFTNATPIPRKPLVLLSSISTPFPSKPTKRKNYLRSKLLKTLTHPYPNSLFPELPSTNTIIPIDSLLQQPPNFPSDQFSDESCPTVAGEELKESESHEFQLSETSDSTEVIEGSIGNFSTRSIFKYGLYFVGAFVLQTICAVWILGSANSDTKNGNLGSEEKTRDSGIELGINGNNKAKSKFLLDGSGNSSYGGKLGFKQAVNVYVDESYLEEKIDEIRAMARDARERERMESKANCLDDDDDNVVVKTGIEKEVDSRLVKLRKRLQNSSEKSNVSSVSYLSKDGKVEYGVVKDGLDGKEVNGALMFKKKYKFRSLSTDPSNKPKGFLGLEDHSVAKMENTSLAPGNEIVRNASIGNDGGDLLDKDQQLDLPNGDLQGRGSMPLEEDAAKNSPMEETKSTRTTTKKVGKERGRTKPRKEMGVAKTKPKSGMPRESSYGRPSVKAVKSGELSKLEAHNSQSFTKENQETITISNKHAVLIRKGSVKGRKVGNKQSANKIGDEKSQTNTDLWWLGLPYVLAILMRSGYDEGPQGLFTLRSTAHTNGDSSHTIAFEDRGDATNFCYLLQSFFEDMGDFSADIVPLSIQELNEAVKSHTMKVLVVKKGQLQLYAGQPFADVEMALHSLVGQS